MPLAPLRMCSYPSCHNLQPCETHKRAQRRREDERRGSSTARGYGGAWQKLRATVLADEPLCRYCQARGLVVASDSVDHMTPKARGGSDDRGNLCGACSTCNYSKGDKTAAEFFGQPEANYA